MQWTVTLTPSKHKQFASLVLAVKVEPAQLCLTAAPVDGKVADGFSRLDASWVKLVSGFQVLVSVSPWRWMACMSAPRGPPHTEMQLSSVRKLFVFPPQPPYEKRRQRDALWSK